MKFYQAARLGLVVMVAATLGGCFDTSETVDKKIAAATAGVQPQTQAPPAAPAPGNAKVVVNCGTKVKVNASASGANPDVNVSIDDCAPPCAADCQPKVEQPPCTTDCPPRVAPPTFYQRSVVPPAPQEYRKGPLVQPAPRVYRPAPVAQNCYVRVDLLERDKVTPYRHAMPFQVVDEAAHRVLKSLTLQPGRNLVAVPCDGRRELCLTIVSRKDGKAIYTRYVTPEWFASHRGNLSRGGVFNPNDPVGFTSKS